MILLNNVDKQWREHIDAIDDLRRGIYLRSYAQQDPVVVFRMESFDMFEEANNLIRENTVLQLLAFDLETAEKESQRSRVRITATSNGSDGTIKKKPVKKEVKVGRNEPCPCGSGKKYKKCCGANE